MNGRRTIFKIKLKNWERHNEKHKKGQPYAMISTRFLDDAKVASLVPLRRLLLLSCILACKEGVSGEAEVNAQWLSRQSGVKPGQVQSALDQLQELQILTYTKTEPLIKLSKINKVIKAKEVATAVAVAPPPMPKQAELLPSEKGTPNSRTIAFYYDLFKKQHGTPPTMRGKERGIITTLLKDVSESELHRLLVAYFKMPDSWVHKTKHDLGVFSMRFQEVKVWADSGKFMTMQDVRDKDREVQGTMEQRDAWEEMDPERRARYLSNFDPPTTKVIGGKQ